jgi:hypothetical protein
VQRLIDYYKSRKDVAFSSKPKSMKLMQEQPYSLAFRKQYPKFNGLIWGYHWLQVGLYEPLMVGKTVDERQAGVRATTARFWQMLQDPPRTFPYQMPMTPAVAPVFAARYQEAAIIFDNLHSMHDVISDILANDSVPRHRKRAEIMLAAERFRDDTSYVMTPGVADDGGAHGDREHGRAVRGLPTDTSDADGDVRRRDVARRPNRRDGRLQVGAGHRRRACGPYEHDPDASRGGRCGTHGRYESRGHEPHRVRIRVRAPIRRAETQVPHTMRCSMA